MLRALPAGPKQKNSRKATLAVATREEPIEEGFATIIDDEEDPIDRSDREEADVRATALDPSGASISKTEVFQ